MGESSGKTSTGKVRVLSEADLDAELAAERAGQQQRMPTTLTGPEQGAPPRVGDGADDIAAVGAKKEGRDA